MRVAGLDCSLEAMRAPTDLVEVLRHLDEATLDGAERVLERGPRSAVEFPCRRQGRTPYMLLRYWPPTS